MSDQNQTPIANQRYSPRASSTYYTNNEIDFRELFIALWAGRVILVLSVLVFSVTAAIYAVYKPNVYQAEAKFFLSNDFYGVKGIVEQRYSENFFSGENFKRELEQRTQHDNLEDVKISYDSRSRIIYISNISTDPEYAYEAVQTVSMALNDVIKQVELKKVNLSINSLLSNLEMINSGNSDEFFDEIYAQQIYKKILLENPASELIQVIDAPDKPTSHIKPKRALIVTLGTLLGGILGVSIILVRFAFRREDD
ncbi:GNVR domain-containing protein [Vibrio brasiliensis]|mgnify:CR=1 FL=1|uniref:Polysaccharide chain length determinant N-terminal domain-containing protein n=1 Tax=Vibrio brasiliensis LMG 20546 TaxID=945543 RepID=E8LR74_9VIBR|nr:GNVR domain-containing protein [Vibrio brasiliensis]EGA66717.1 hypothetical protein VIBR0546_14672 [Vibrio brasiliensis LMG 20546]